jgi:hypothetical protein
VDKLSGQEPTSLLLFLALFPIACRSDLILSESFLDMFSLLIYVLRLSVTVERAQ